MKMRSVGGVWLLIALACVDCGKKRSVESILAQPSAKTVDSLGRERGLEDDQKIEQLVRMGPEAVVGLVDYLNNKANWKNSVAIVALGRLKDKKGTDTLCMIALNSGSYTEVAAVEALAEIADKRSIPCLIRVWKKSINEYSDEDFFQSTLARISGIDKGQNVSDWEKWAKGRSFE
jgi:HEAT repeat protein